MNQRFVIKIIPSSVLVSRNRFSTDFQFNSLYLFMQFFIEKALIYYVSHGWSIRSTSAQTLYFPEMLGIKLKENVIIFDHL